MNTITGKRIAIVGGGPGGLTLARLLQIKGADVKVYERDEHKDVRVQGATLDLHEDSGLKALGQAGLMDAFMANYRPDADLLRITDNNATIVYDQHSEERPDSLIDAHFRPEIDRGPLRKILLESLQPETVVWDSNITSLEQVGNEWRLYFRNGTTATADIVIGADGANSKVRPMITAIKPFFAGLTAIEGNVYDAETTVPNIQKLVKGGKIFAMANDRTLIVSAKGDGSLAFYTGFKTDESWMYDCGIDFKDNAQVLDWFKKDFPEWDSVWHELFNNDKTYFVPRPQYCMPLDQHWEAQPNITMLGDAAHLMPPYAGEGVNMAMLDALELSNSLTSEAHKDTHTAIASFENEMRDRASTAAKMSIYSMELMHSPNAITRIMEIFEGHDGAEDERQI